MNHFGVILIIEKDNGLVSNEEKADIQQQLSDIMLAKRYADFRRTGNYRTLHAWDEESICSRLVEYWEEENADEVKEIAEDEELPLAQEIAEELQQRMGDDFWVTASVEEW